MRMRISIFAAIAIAATSAIVIATSGNESAAKPKQQDFVIAGSDGYGTQECLTSRSDCGRIVADAWCESKGFRTASAYRQLGRDEITGSTSSVGGKPVESFLISCKN